MNIAVLFYKLFEVSNEDSKHKYHNSGDHFLFVYLEQDQQGVSDVCQTSERRLTPVSRLHIGGVVAGCVSLVPGVFPGLKLTGTPIDSLNCPRFPRFLSWHICLVFFVNGHYWC